jgi:hypothetical protein
MSRPFFKLSHTLFHSYMFCGRIKLVIKPQINFLTECPPTCSVHLFVAPAFAPDLHNIFGTKFSLYPSNLKRSANK